MGSCCSVTPSTSERTQIYAAALAIAAAAKEEHLMKMKTAPSLHLKTAPSLPSLPPIQQPPQGLFSRSGGHSPAQSSTSAAVISVPPAPALAPAKAAECRPSTPRDPPVPDSDRTPTGSASARASPSASNVPSAPRSPASGLHKTIPPKSEEVVILTDEEKEHLQKRRARRRERRRGRQQASISHVVSVHISSQVNGAPVFAQSVGIGAEASSPPPQRRQTNISTASNPLPQLSAASIPLPLAPEQKHGRRLSDALEGGLQAQNMLIALAKRPDAESAPSTDIDTKTVPLKEGEDDSTARLQRAPTLSYRRALSQKRLATSSSITISALSEEITGSLKDLKSSRTARATSQRVGSLYGLGENESESENTLNMPLEDGLRLKIVSPDGDGGASTTRSIASTARSNGNEDLSPPTAGTPSAGFSSTPSSMKFGSLGSESSNSARSRRMNNTGSGSSDTFSKRFGSVLKSVPTVNNLDGSPVKSMNSLMLATPTAPPSLRRSYSSVIIRGSLGSGRLPAVESDAASAIEQVVKT